MCGERLDSPRQWVRSLQTRRNVEIRRYEVGAVQYVDAAGAQRMQQIDHRRLCRDRGSASHQQNGANPAQVRAPHSHRSDRRPEIARDSSVRVYPDCVAEYFITERSGRQNIRQGIERFVVADRAMQNRARGDVVGV